MTAVLAAVVLDQWGVAEERAPVAKVSAARARAVTAAVATEEAVEGAMLIAVATTKTANRAVMASTVGQRVVIEVVTAMPAAVP